MKQFNLLKSLSLFIIAMATAVAFSCCSSDKDEPENPDHSDSESGFGTESMIPYTSLPGTWVIESIKETETGAVTKINQTITIKKFDVTREHVDPADIVTDDGYEFWGEGYDDILSYDNNVDNDHHGILFGFCKPQNKGLGSTLIYQMTLTIKCFDNEGDNITQVFSLTDLHLSGNTLTAKESAYSSLTTPMIVGTLTMKKL